jgi:zinc transport system substrate-binding protein
MTKKIVNIAVVLLLFLITFITSSIAENQSQNLRIYVVNYPLKYFAEGIGGEKVDVFFPAPSGTDPAYWTPSREIIKQYQQADLILLNGADYAKWINKVTLPKSKFVDTSKSFKADYIPLEDTVTHSHGLGGEHAHKGVAFTTWLDPLLAIKQAEAIKEELIKLMPGQEEYFTNNFESFKSDLDGLNNKLEKIVSPDPNKPLVASHPVYQYLTRRHNLNLKSVHWEPDEVPGPDQMKELDIILENHPAQWMIWEAEPKEETKSLLREKGIQTFVFNPAGNTPDNGDYLDVMNRNADNLSGAYK